MRLKAGYTKYANGTDARVEMGGEGEEEGERERQACVCVCVGVAGAVAVCVLCVFGTAAGSNLVAIILHILAGGACRRQLIPSCVTPPALVHVIYESHAFDGSTNCTKYSHTATS